MTTSESLTPERQISPEEARHQMEAFMTAAQRISSALQILPPSVDVFTPHGGTSLDYAVPVGVDMKLYRLDGQVDVAQPKHLPGFRKGMPEPDEIGYMFDQENPLDITGVSCQVSAEGVQLYFAGPEGTLQIPISAASDYYLYDFRPSVAQ